MYIIYIYIIYPPKMNTISFSLWKKAFGGSSIHPVDQRPDVFWLGPQRRRLSGAQRLVPHSVGATSEERSVAWRATGFTKDSDTEQ